MERRIGTEVLGDVTNFGIFLVFLLGLELQVCFWVTTRLFFPRPCTRLSSLDSRDCCIGFSSSLTISIFRLAAARHGRTISRIDESLVLRGIVAV